MTNNRLPQISDYLSRDIAARINRDFVGFDRLFNTFKHAETALNSATYPPYNIEMIDDENYRITLAVAGFGKDDIDITQEDRMLVITGAKEGKESDVLPAMLYNGIANRSFERKFILADLVEVEDCSLENGLLSVHLKRHIPEELKPRKIKISDSGY